MIMQIPARSIVSMLLLLASSIAMPQTADPQGTPEAVALGHVSIATGQQSTRTLAITHVTVIDATGAPAKPDMTVVITGNRIATIGAARNVVVPRGAQVVDGKGQYLIPGLWDMHVHLFSPEMPWPAGPGISNKDWFFPLFIANGVTGVRDMFTESAEIKLAA